MSHIEQSLSAGEKVEGIFELHWTAKGIDAPIAVKRAIESIGNPID